MTEPVTGKTSRGRIAGHKPVPRYRPYSGLALFAQGFRPFFLLAGLWGAGALALSIALFEGWIVLPTAFDPVAWHYHEMLFGFAAAAMAGFLLTAIPNWTGRLPLQGAPLFFLVLLWLCGRAAVAASATVGVWPAALADLAFLAAFAAAILREIVAGRNWGNLPVVAAVVLILACNALSHAALMGAVDDGLARRLPIAVFVILISLIGGRIVPSFTRNWLAKRNEARLPAGFGAIDRVALTTTLAALFFWALAPLAATTGALAALAAMLSGLRLARWRGVATFGEPLLWVLHLAFLWIPAGLALIALAALTGAVPPTAALHALTAGAMGTMILAVISRATLGHTGKPLTAGAGLTASYVLITLAALARILAPAVHAFYAPLLLAAAAAWIAAFTIFLVVCGPMLLSLRS